MVNLYSGDVVAATSSKGNQEKWFDTASNKWYKLDTYGFESLAEAVAGDVLRRSNIESELGYKVVQYRVEKVVAHKKERICCVSENFLAPDEELVTVAHLLKQALGSNYQELLRHKRTIGQKLQLIVDTVQSETNLERFGEYLTLLFECDALILNEDRHLNNIAVIYSPRGYYYCPLFDNGASFLLDLAAYPLDVDTKSFFERVEAKPFQMSFRAQVAAARKLYGGQLKMMIGRGEIADIAAEHLAAYPPMYVPYLAERITTILTRSSTGL